MSKSTILEAFQILTHGNEGIGAWINPNTDDKVFQRLDEIDRNRLSKVQFNQLLAFGHEAPVSDDVYAYYWHSVPELHPYPVASLPGFKREFIAGGTKTIKSVEHLVWGLYRIYVDGLLYYGNVRNAFRKLRALTQPELRAMFEAKRIDTQVIKSRGPALPLDSINIDDRYLISEMACKSYGDVPGGPAELRKALFEAYKLHTDLFENHPITIKELLTDRLGRDYASRQSEFLFSVDDVVDETVSSEKELDEKFSRISNRFFGARSAALSNTKYYLSMVNDLDVYVATSMRSRADFRQMASFCAKIFSNELLKDMQLRYFDPTLRDRETIIWSTSSCSSCGIVR